MKKAKLDGDRAETFEASATIGALRPVSTEQSSRLKAKSLEMLGECAAYKDSMEADTDGKTKFNDDYETLLLRYELLKAVLGESQGADPDEDERGFNAFKDSSQVQDAMPYSEFHPRLYELLSYAATHAICTAIGRTAYDETEELKATLIQTHKDMSDLRVHTRGQLTRLKG